jgi:aldehyde:ferredoxin oxidoreductase
MAAGVPPVVLANRAEGYIVEDGVTGLVAGDEDAYARALEELYRNPELRRRLAGNAREAAAKLFSLDLMASRWEQVFDEILSLPKTARNWRGSYRGQSVSAHRIFLESLGDYGKEFICSLQAGNEKDQEAAREGIKKLCASSYLWRSNTRGTPHHYHNFFPEDNFLKLWSGFLKEESTVP